MVCRRIAFDQGPLNGHLGLRAPITAGQAMNVTQAQ